MINIIQEYEEGRITLEELAEAIHGYGERLVAEVGEEKFGYYVRMCTEINMIKDK